MNYQIYKKHSQIINKNLIAKFRMLTFKIYKLKKKKLKKINPKYKIYKQNCIKKYTQELNVIFALCYLQRVFDTNVKCVMILTCVRIV